MDDRNKRKQETIEFMTALSTEAFRLACVIALVFMLCMFFALMSDTAQQFVRDIAP